MSKFLLLLLPLLLAQSTCAQYREDAQSSPTPQTPPALQTPSPAQIMPPGEGDVMPDSTAALPPSAGEKLMYLGGAALAMGLFDYVGYNLVRGNSVTLPIYRVVQALVQLGVSYLLYEKLGLPTAIAFNLVWWTWGLDAIFYGYTELFNVGGSWKSRGVFQADIMDNNCKWASWTPIGIAQGADPNKKLAGDALMAQTLVGAVLAVTITVSF